MRRDISGVVWNICQQLFKLGGNIRQFSSKDGLN